jgi:hypothetical protein
MEEGENGKWGEEDERGVWIWRYGGRWVPWVMVGDCLVVICGELVVG